jgi:hypothetical protein
VLVEERLDGAWAPAGQPEDVVGGRAVAAGGEVGGHVGGVLDLERGQAAAVHRFRGERNRDLEVASADVLRDRREGDGAWAGERSRAAPA